MRLTAVWSDAVLEHVPEAVIWVSVRTPVTEVAARAQRVARGGGGGRGAPGAAVGHDDETLATVHDPLLLAHLRTVHDDWTVAGFRHDPGQNNVVPSVFPTTAMLDGLPPRDPTAVHARAGRYCYGRPGRRAGGAGRRRARGRLPHAEPEYPDGGGLVRAGRQGPVDSRAQLVVD